MKDSGIPVVALLGRPNVDNPRSPDFYEFSSLGLGDPIPVSANNGMGSGDLLDQIVEHLPPNTVEESTALSIAVVGRPNVGESSFVNRLLGEQRLVVSDVAGTTRDAIDTPMRYHGRDLVFIDTAGLRRQSRGEEGIEVYSALRTRRAIERAEICLLLVEPSEGGLENQDLKIAALAWEAGRGLIVVVNKWDLAERDDKAAARFEKKAREKAPYLNFVPFLFTSAKPGLRGTHVLDLILAVDVERQKRITTSEVNERLGGILAWLQPP